jgi:hypothetical protein
MVIDILIAQGQSVSALRKQVLELMIHPTRIPQIVKAPGQASAHSEPSVHLAEQQHPSVAGERPPGEICDYFARPQVLKKQRFVLTLCRGGSGGWYRHLA